MRMKISDEQREAASIYWSQILTGELAPKELLASKQPLPSFMASIEAENRKSLLIKLKTTNPSWPRNFMHTLSSLLSDADDTLCLRLEYEPQGFLKQAANKVGIPEGLFPSGKLSMYFDDENNIIVGDDEIDADAFIKDAAQKMAAIL